MVGSEEIEFQFWKGEQNGFSSLKNFSFQCLPQSPEILGQTVFLDLCKWKKMCLDIHMYYMFKSCLNIEVVYARTVK